jgi:drug/metabolite transporter (DMT)-like permease
MPTSVIPLVFVVLWSSGFIFAKLAGPYTEPLTFLALRFWIVAVILGVVALVMRTPWPARRDVAHAFVAGALLHGVYLGPVFWAIGQGMSAGISAVIVSMQPILTALLAPALLGERIERRQWLGLALGVAGVLLVLAPKVAAGSADARWDTVGLSLVALCGITAGNIYQKRFASGLDLRTGGTWQFAGGASLMTVGMLLLERGHIDPQPPLIIAMFGSIFVLSLGAITLLMLMIRRGAASQTAAWFFLVPPVTALMAFFLFGEHLVPLQLFGMVLACLAVALVTRAVVVPPSTTAVARE